MAQENGHEARRPGADGSAAPADRRYLIAKGADGWSVIDARTAEVVVVGAQVQRGLSGCGAEGTADRLNRAGGLDAMSATQVALLLSGRPRPCFEL